MNSFYLDLPVVENFVDITNPAVYAELPDHWHVAVTDVRDSTGAIARGKYKEVNLIGASSIIALLNLTESFSLPFLFAGDGAAVCVPDSLLEQARGSLSATRRMAKDVYDLELRVGIVPVRYIRERNFNVLIARYRISENFVQAIFSGGGLQFAEDCIKDPALAPRFAVTDGEGESSADFSGLECRWKNVPSARGEIVSLIVQAVGNSGRERSDTYRAVIEKIGEVYGTDAMCRPVREGDLEMSLTEKQLSGESRIRSYGKGGVFRIWYWFRVRYAVIIGWGAMKLRYESKNVNWGRYKSDLAANTDFKKFDDKLREVLSGTSEQRRQLTDYLEECLQRRQLVYGIHVAPTALITCLIFSYNGAHIHLVDSDNGGYAVAAMQLKNRLKQLQL